MTARGVVESLWISPREHPDFGWTLLSRVLVNFGNAFGTSLLLYFLEFGLHDAHADDDLLILILIYMVFVIVASLVLGRLSDRIGRRKVFVFVSSALQGVAALLLAFVPDLSVAMVAAGLLGLGYGCFLSVDQALATQVLPDPENRGKDLGIMNIATAVPQAIAPLIGAGIVAAPRRVRRPVRPLRRLRVRGCARGRPSESGALMPDSTSPPRRPPPSAPGPRRTCTGRRCRRRRPRLDPALAVAAPPRAPAQRPRHAPAGRRQADPGRLQVGAGALGAGCGARRPRLPRRARVHAARGAVAGEGGRRASADRGCRGRLSDRRPRRDRPAGGVPGARRPGHAHGRLGRAPRPHRRRRPARRARDHPASASSSTRPGTRPVLGHVGVWRSPVYTAAAGARALAEAIVRRPGLRAWSG